MSETFVRVIQAIIRTVKAYTPMIFYVLSVLLCVRLAYSIYAYGMNLFTYDAWARNLGFIKHPTLFSLFMQQDAGMFQGLSYIFTYYLAKITNFNATAEYWHSFVYLVGAWWCLWRIVKNQYRLSVFDVLVPLVLFSVRNHFLLFKNASASYGTFPVCMLFLTWYINTWKWGLARVACGSIALLFLVYSGYGYFALPAYCIYLVVEFLFVASPSKKKYVVYALTLFVGISLVYFYNFDASLLVDHPTQMEYQFGVSQLVAYLVHFFGYHMVPIPFVASLVSDSIWFGVFVLAYVWGIVVFVKRKTPLYFMPFLGMTYTVIFAISNALGRVSLGLSAAEALRYELHFTPFFFGVFLLLRTMRHGIKKTVLYISVFCIMLYRELSYALIIPPQYLVFVNQQKAFKFCVQLENPIDECEKQSGIEIFLDNSGKHLIDKPEYAPFLQYLKDKKANLYAPDRKYPH